MCLLQFAICNHHKIYKSCACMRVTTGKKSEIFLEGWRTARPPSDQGTKVLAVGFFWGGGDRVHLGESTLLKIIICINGRLPPKKQASRKPCQDKATLIFPLEKGFICMTIIILYNLEISLFIYKFITSFKINRRGTPLLTNLLLESSIFHEKRADVTLVPVSLPATFDGFSQVYPPPPPNTF